jgi:hypothetical protein
MIFQVTYRKVSYLWDATAILKAFVNADNLELAKIEAKKKYGEENVIKVEGYAGKK